MVMPQGFSTVRVLMCVYIYIYIYILLIQNTIFNDSLYNSNSKMCSVPRVLFQNIKDMIKTRHVLIN